MENNGAMDIVVRMAMENAEMKTRLSVLANMVAIADKDCEDKSYGASLYTRDIRIVLGWQQ